jgi:1,2-diacylglycerol-3-alpha-glucose alpha-1,2-galactosyltransferase
MKKIRVNMVSESEIYVRGHGVHTAYVEMAEALKQRDDVTVIMGEFGKPVACDVIHLHTIGLHAWYKLLQKGPKKVISAHVVPASLVGSIILAQYWLFALKWYMRLIYNRADKVLAVSSAVADTLHDELHVPREKIELFHNTVDMKRYAFSQNDKDAARKKLHIKKDAFVVLCTGQVQPRKRLDIFIKMANTLPDVQFIWVGGIPFKQLGADYASMQRLMNSTPPNLKVTGIIPHEEVSDYLASANVFCLPAEQENHPMCVLEAAGANLPIIVRDIPEYDDTFKHDVIRCNDDTFTEAVVKLRDDKDFYKKQVQKTKLVAKRFDSQVAGERLTVLYYELIKRTTA